MAYAAAPARSRSRASGSDKGSSSSRSSVNGDYTDNESETVPSAPSRALVSKSHYVPFDLQQLVVHHRFGKNSLRPFFNILKEDLNLTADFDEVYDAMERLPVALPPESPVHTLMASLYEDMHRVTEENWDRRQVQINFDIEKGQTEIAFDILRKGTRAGLVHDVVVTHATTSSEQARFEAQHLVYRNASHFESGSVEKAKYGCLNNKAKVNYGGKKPVKYSVVSFDKALPIENKHVIQAHTDVQKLIAYPPLQALLRTVRVTGHYVEVEINGLQYKFQSPLLVAAVRHMHRLHSPLRELKLEEMFAASEKNIKNYMATFRTDYPVDAERLQQLVSDSSSKPLATDDAKYLTDIYRSLGFVNPRITTNNLPAARQEILTLSEYSYKANLQTHFAALSPERQVILHHYVFDRGGRHYLRLDWFTFLCICKEHADLVENHERIVNPTSVHTLRLVRADGEPIVPEKGYASVGLLLQVEPRDVQDTDTNFFDAWATAAAQTQGRLWNLDSPRD